MHDVPTKPRLMILNRSYWPDQEATGQLLTDLCEALTQEMDPVVLVGQPNSVEPGVSFRRIGREVRNGVSVTRVPHTRFGKRWMLGRCLDFASYSLSVGVTACFSRRPDLLVVETDPPTLAVLGTLLRWRFRCPFVVYLQDIYPDIAVTLGKIREGWVSSAVRSMLRFAYSRADRIVVLSEDMRSTLLQWGLDANRIVIVPNWVDTDAVQPTRRDNSCRRDWGIDHEFVVMYSGNIGLSQRLEDILEAATLLRHRDDIQFFFIGKGASRASLEARSRDLGLTNIRFLDYQPRDRLSQSLGAADLHLIPVAEGVLASMMPSKLYGILASGSASVAVAAEDTELARTLQDNEAGLVVPPNRPVDLARAIEDLASRPCDVRQMGERARSLAVSCFDVSHCTALLRDLFRELARPVTTQTTR